MGELCIDHLITTMEHLAEEFHSTKDEAARRSLYRLYLAIDNSTIDTKETL